MIYDQYGNELSWKPILTADSGIPLYQVLVNAIQNDIDRGILKRGFRMPPQRILANQLDLNHGTVSRAYKICEEKGLINGIVGRGTYIAASPGLPLSMLTDHQDSDLISLGMALPLYECNSLIEESVRALADTVDYSLMLKYCPPEGHIKHRYVAANWMESYQIKVDPENILITSGTQNALSIILMTQFEKGDRILVDEFTYTGLKSLAAYLKIILIPVSGNRQGMDLDELKSICKREQPKGIYLISDYQNPTTVTLSEKKRQQLAEIIKTNQLLLIEDATFSFSLETKIAPISSYIPESSFYLLGTSKAISPSFRISYIVAPSRFLRQLQHGLNNIIWMASPYTSEIISLLQSTGAYERITRDKIARLKARNQLLDSILASYDIVEAPTACYRFLNLPSSYDDHELEYLALERGIQIFSAHRFYIGSHPQGCPLRISVSAPNTIEDLEKGLYILRDILENYKRGSRVSLL